jgi:hypothetical protein
MQTFETGATRSADEHKPDYEGFVSPLVIWRYGQYMLKHRVQDDGEVRDSDNWQLGIPLKKYMKSMWRHFLDVWLGHRGWSTEDMEESLCALYFNVQGYLHEYLKEKYGTPEAHAGVGTPGAFTVGREDLCVDDLAVPQPDHVYILRPEEREVGVPRDGQYIHTRRR